MRIYIWISFNIRGPMCSWDTHIFAYLTSFYSINVARHLWFNLGNITDSCFFLNILTFRGLFQVIKFNEPSKIYIFNFKSKVFDKMRIMSSLRSLRLLRSLRPVRSLMPGKWLNMWSANCHSHQKGINRPKMLKIFFERSFTFGTFKLFFLQNFFARLQIGP